MGLLAAAAVDDAGEPLAFRSLDQVAGLDGLQARRAGEVMDIVARQQDDLAGADLDGFAVDLAHQPAADHEVIGEDLRRRRHVGCAILRRELRPHTPRRRESRLEKDTAGQADRAQHLR